VSIGLGSLHINIEIIIIDVLHMASRSQITIPINHNVQHDIRCTVTRLWPSSEWKDKEYLNT